MKIKIVITKLLRSVLPGAMLAVCLATTMTPLQALTLTWEQNIAGVNFDDGFDVCTVNNSDAVFIGSTRSTSATAAGQPHILITRIDRTGAVVWSQVVNVISDETGYSITEANGGYVVWTANIWNATNLSWDVLVCKMFSATGGIVWIQQLNAVGEDRAASIIEASDGTYMIAGWSTSPLWGMGGRDVLVVKLDALTGGTVWSNLYGTQDRENAWCIRENSNGDYVIAGEYDYLGNTLLDGLLLKINSAGVLQWTHRYGEMLTMDGFASIAIGANDDIYACGVYNDGIMRSDIFAARINTNGTPVLSLHRYNFVGAGIGQNGAWDIIESHTPGNYVLTGYSQLGVQNGTELITLELGPNLGIPVRSQVYGSTNSDYGRGITKFTDFNPDPPPLGSSEEGYWLVGYMGLPQTTPHDWYILRVNSWLRTGCSLGGDVSFTTEKEDAEVEFNTVQYLPTTTPEITLGGLPTLAWYCQPQQLFPKQTAPYTGTPTLSVADPAAHVVPQPLQRGEPGELKFNASEAGPATVTVLDIQGRTMMRFTIQATVGRNTALLPSAKLQAGMYNIRIDLKDATLNEQFIIR